MQSLVAMNITAVRQSNVIFSKNYTVVFGEGMVKSDPRQNEMQVGANCSLPELRDCIEP